MYSGPRAAACGFVDQVSQVTLASNPESRYARPTARRNADCEKNKPCDVASQGSQD